MRNFRLLLIILILLPACSRGVHNGNKDKGINNTIPAEAMYELQTSEDMDVLIEQIGNSRIVLLGEASHGTSEFYTWRAEISKRLITEKGFDIIAVEGDWADAYPVNSYIQGSSNYSTAQEALGNFNRWPEWMWKNKEVAELIEWLHGYNKGKNTAEKAGFYGLDVYGIWESLEVVYNYLQQVDPTSSVLVNDVRDCFAPYGQDEQAYARATVNSSVNCSEKFQILLEAVESTSSRSNDEASFNAIQNALVAVNAENYYRTAVRNSSSSWNIRDRHMTTIINNLLEHYGPASKIIIWEHNTHVGDARATDMVNAGMVNVGQLVREQYGDEEAYIVGFGTYSGKVLASERWGDNLKVMNVPPARRNSWEWILHNQGPKNKIIFLDYLKGNDFFSRRIGHRAIGVVYNPMAESGNYVPSELPARYDAFISIDQTSALDPIP